MNQVFDQLLDLIFNQFFVDFSSPFKIRKTGDATSKKKKRNGMSPDEPLVMCRKMEIHFLSYGGAWLYVGKGTWLCIGSNILYI